MVAENYLRVADFAVRFARFATLGVRVAVARFALTVRLTRFTALARAAGFIIAPLSTVAKLRLGASG